MNQKGNYDASTNTAASGEAAGVELYAFASSQRAAASESHAAQEEIEKAKTEGTLAEDDEVSFENLSKTGMASEKAKRLSDAYAQHRRQVERLDDDRMISGFGSNGGEEFLSYMLTSESLVINGGEAWTQWNAKMHRLLEKAQCPGGSWTGHHCITSPVFCTAAVVQCLTAERDADLLRAVARASTQDDDKASA